MSKAEFLTKLRESLNGLAPADINTSMEFYSEIIDDRMDLDVLARALTDAALDRGGMDNITALLLRLT